jgi:hypothetical protein
LRRHSIATEESGAGLDSSAPDSIIASA